MANVCETITPQQDIGLFYLDMNNFKNKLLPRVKQCPDDVGITMAE